MIDCMETEALHDGLPEARSSSLPVPGKLSPLLSTPSNKKLL